MSTVHKHKHVHNLSTCQLGKHEHELESHEQEACYRADSSSGDCLDSNSKIRCLQPEQQTSSDHLCICVLQDAAGTEGVLQASL
jgi:hypothetical protein